MATQLEFNKAVDNAALDLLGEPVNNQSFTLNYKQ